MRFFLALGLLIFSLTAAAAQTLKVGDQLNIQVMQDPKLDRTVVVDPSGRIAFPLAGHVRAAGQTPQALENLLKSKLKNDYKDDDLDITVALTNVERPDQDDDLKPKVFVMGEVLRPGSYTVRRRTTLMQAIALAGGFSPFAAKARIQIRRQLGGTETTSTFNYRAFESGSDLSGNIDLHAGDVIIVPERGILEF